MTEDDLSYEPPPVLLPCSICSRTFRPDVLDRHTKVCEKTATKKRRVFDSFKSRVSGTELEEFLGPAPLPGQAPKRPERSPVKKSRGTPKWKETHENLIAVLRAARGVPTADPAAVIAPKNSENEQCPSCGRFFGPRAFDRHVQFCKEKMARIKLTPSKVSQAQERLEARTKYKAPLSLKPKLTTKEKYSPMLPRKVDSAETVTSSGKTPGNSLANKSSKSMAGKSNLSSNFSRQSASRSSERQRSVSPKKPLASSSKVIREPQGKVTTQPKIKDNLRNTEDFRPRTGMKMSTQQERIRNPNLKSSELEDESPKSNRNCRVNRKSCLSSDDGNETDSLNSTTGSACNSEKETKRKESLPGSPGGKKGKREPISSPKISEERESRCSRRSKVRLPLINDLSVNDESFGIHVAPCQQRSQLRRKSTAKRKKKAPTEEAEVGAKAKVTLNVIVPQVRSSKIPKPLTKGSESRQEEEIFGDGTDEDESQKNRERTAGVSDGGLKKWRDISGVSTNDLLRMSDDFDFISELDDLEASYETEDVSHPTLWEPSECRGSVSNVLPTEDEFIVLHVAEPEKMSDDDAMMKMSVSEPCFKTDYPDQQSMLNVMKASSNVFVFDSPPRFSRKRTSSRKASKASWSRKAKAAPKKLTIRERTFLASDSPVPKRRKLADRVIPPQPKIANINDFFFGITTKIRAKHGKFGEERAKESETGDGKKREKRRRMYEYFEIGEDVEVNKTEDVGNLKPELEKPVSNRQMEGKCTIYYSDEEFEELRQKKENSLKGFSSKSIKENIETPTDLIGLSEIELQSPRSELPELSAIDSLETVKVTSLANITEEEEEEGEERPDSTERSIEIEDFIIKKPNKSTIMSKSGNCLDDLFPRPPEIDEPKGAESSTAISLSYVVDSLYDLRNGGNVLGRSLIKKKKKEGLPVIAEANKKIDRAGNSMSSLIQIWKTRKEMIESGSLSEKSRWKSQAKSSQIALLPLVLTQKLAEVAERLDSTKSKDDKYDPFKQAERQMMTLLSWPSTADLKTEKDQPPKSGKAFQPNRTTKLETSSTSAFSRYNSSEEEPTKEAKENVNLRKAENAGRKSSSGAGSDYRPMYSAADDWEQIFEKHFDLNRNETSSEKATRSVKSALDGLLKSYPSSPDEENSPPRKNRSGLSESSPTEEIAYTSTPKRTTPQMRKISGRGRTTPPEDRDRNRNSGVSLSSLSFCSHASDTTLADEEIMRTNLEIIGVGKSTPRTSKRRFARSQSVFDERNRMLYAKAFNGHFSSSDENDQLPTIDDSVRKMTNPKSVPSRFPRSQSVMDGRCKGDGDHERDEISSPEGGKSRRAKMSGDSAYSSLNRRSPRSGLQASQQEDRLSSSGSERSLPPLGHDHPLKPVSLNFDNTASTRKDQPYKMSKFCHECGSKYPVAVAKFCCECGVRRLII